MPSSTSKSKEKKVIKKRKALEAQLQRRSFIRVGIYILLFLALLASYLLLRGVNWQGGIEFHTLIELTATILALVAGILALIKYSTRKKKMYLFVGAGLIAAFILDGYHTLFTSGYFYQLFGDSIKFQEEWSWGASRILLSVLIFLSWVDWKFEEKTSRIKKSGDKLLYIFVITLAFLSLAAFALFPLSSAFQDKVRLFTRLQELLSGVFFFLSLIGYLTKGFWRKKYFEHWLVIGLIVSIFIQVLFLPSSGQLYDTMFNTTHLLKSLSYTFMLIGLFMSVYVAHTEVEASERKLSKQYLALQKAKSEVESRTTELADERDRMGLIISSMGEGLLVIDNDYKINLMNKKAEELLGVPKEEAVGEQWCDIVKAYKGDTEIQFDQRTSIKVLKTGRTIVTKIEDDHYYLTKIGKKFSVASITAPLFGDGVIGAVKVFRDATAEKEAKAIIEQKVEERTRELRIARDKISEGWLQLQQEKARLTSSIYSLPMGFFIIDKDHNIAIINPALKEILGATTKKWTFKTLSERFKKGGVNFDQFCAHCRGDSASFGLDDVLFDDKILRIISVPILLPVDHEVIGTVVLVEDVTEEKLLERTKDEFFAVASHELRTPLTAIRGNTSLIRDYFADKLEDKDLKEIINDMHTSSIRLIDIVNDFLNVSRLEQGRIEFKKEKFNLYSLIKVSLEELEANAKAKNLYLKLEEPKGDLPEVRSDKDRVKQVLVNLVGNGIIFTEKGGVTIEVKEEKRSLKVAIEDTGIGISKKNQRLLFKKFQQAGERVLARDITRGTGMGLYISKLLIEGMGGKIYLEKSELDKGSTFVFTLPIAGPKKSG